MPVVGALSPHVRVSIDTTKRAVAEAAVEAGATIINDVSAASGRAAAEAGVGLDGHAMVGSGADRGQASLGDVVADVAPLLVARADDAVSRRGRRGLDRPGIGFGKSLEQNMALVARIDELVETGLPVLVGVSPEGHPRRTARRVGCARRRTGTARDGGCRRHSTGELRRAGAPGDRIEASLTMATCVLMQGAALVPSPRRPRRRPPVTLVSGAVAA